tara:strand:- start:2820 stop:3860 length:1041 start_codon:yes stop_codon:yes gene_type:complete
MPTHPESPLTALSRFSALTVVPSQRSSADWSRVAPEVRSASFFSAKVEDARFLDRAKMLIEDNISGARNSDGSIKVGSKQQFITQMRQHMDSEGMGTNFANDSITNIGGHSRLSLIFDTNVRQSYDYAYYAQGMTPLMLDRFPALEFVRLEDPEEPRPRHVAHEGDVRLKTDTAYWLYQNAADIGGLGVPWGPWGFNSLMGTEEQTRALAEAKGLINPGEPAYSPESEALRKESPATSLQASTKTMDKAIRRQLEKELKAKSDKQFSKEALAKERAAREQEQLLYSQLDALNDTNAPPGQINQVERQLFDIEQERERRGTSYIYRIGRGVGGIIRFLGDALFRVFR